MATPGSQPAARPDAVPRVKAGSQPRTLATHLEPVSCHSLPVFRVLGEPPKSAVERGLSVFADVRAGEGTITLPLAFNVFLLLPGYSVMEGGFELVLRDRPYSGSPYSWSCSKSSTRPGGSLLNRRPVPAHHA